MTYDRVRTLALTFPGAEESTSYGTPAIKIRGKLMVRLRDDLDAVVVRMPIPLREELIAKDPGTFFITDHYLKYDWVLVRLSAVKVPKLREILEIAFTEVTAPPAKAKGAIRTKRRAP